MWLMDPGSKMRQKKTSWAHMMPCNHCHPQTLLSATNKLIFLNNFLFFFFNWWMTPVVYFFQCIWSKQSATHISMSHAQTCPQTIGLKWGTWNAWVGQVIDTLQTLCSIYLMLLYSIRSATPLPDKSFECRPLQEPQAGITKNNTNILWNTRMSFFSAAVLNVAKWSDLSWCLVHLLRRDVSSSQNSLD